MTNSATHSVSTSRGKSLWEILPSDFDLDAIEVLKVEHHPSIVPVAQTQHNALDAAPDEGAARAAVANNFGFLDIAAGGPADGLASAADIASGARAGVLREPDAAALAALVASPEVFSRLDARDGLTDGRLTFSAVLRAQPGEAEVRVGVAGAEVPDAFVARYNDDFLAQVTAIAKVAPEARSLDAQSLAGLSGKFVSPAGFAALDSIDSVRDGAVSAAGFGAAFDVNAQVLGAPATDGTGTVLQASLAAMLADYGQIDAKNPDLSAEDRLRVQFAGAMSARMALTSGIPMDHGAAGFDADMDQGFVAARLLDESAVTAACDKLLAEPAILADLSAKVQRFSADAITLARGMEGRMSSTLYADALRAMERAGEGEAARAIAVQDMAALRLLDPAASDRAALRLAENLAAAVIEEGDFATLPGHTATLAIDDVLQTMIGLKAARVGLRETGRVATLLSSLDDIKGELLATRQAVSSMAANLANLFNYTRSAGGDIGDAQRLLGDLEMSGMKSSIPAPDREKLKSFIHTLDRAGVWQTGAAIFGVVGGVYRLAHPGVQPWDRLYAAQEFLASASYITGPAKAFGQFLKAHTTVSADFHSAMKAPLVDLMKSGSGSLSRTSLGSVTSTGASTPALEIAPTPRTAAATVKAFAALTEVGSAVMGITIGAKAIADGVAQDDTARTVLGSVTLTSGVATMAGAVLGTAFAVGTPLLVAGGLLSIGALIASALLQKSGDQVMGDQFENRWGAQGFLKEGWREQVTQWWVGHTNIESGMGLDM